jgi:cyclic-di-AMP phosphodiesterase PgpH
MRKLILFLKKHSHIISRVLLLLLSVAILVSIFPHKGNFPYEFQKGKPWMHDDYVASFDFPIMKTEAEIKIEKDSILKEYKPYFNYQKNISGEQLKKFNRLFNNQWVKFVDGRTEQKLSNDIIIFFKNADSVKKDNYLKYAGNLLTYVYNKGIIQVTDQIEQFAAKDFALVIIRDNIGEDYEFSDVFTPKTAYEYIFSQIHALDEGNANDRILYKSGFFKELNLNEFLIPNLIYNEEASHNVKQELIKQISLTKGMFLSNHKVIENGEIVNDEKYNLLMSLKKEYENKLGNSAVKNSYLIAGQVLIVGALLLLLLVYMVRFRREVYSNNLKFSFILLMIIIVVGISSVVIKNDYVNLYIIPFALLPIIVKTFYDARLALFSHTVAILMVGFIAPNGFEFVFLNFTTGTIAIVGLTSLYRRGQLFSTAFFVIITYCLLYFGIYLLQGGELQKLTWQNFIFFGISGFLLLLAYPFIFVFERMFGFLSDITLMELSNTNQELLRKLSEKAPGTFQHSLQVANLAEEAAYKIGANPLLVRTGALYHDVGKLYNPVYFIENLHNERNPHAELSNEESAQIIIDHVYKGLEIARKNRLPDLIIDFIRTHHGTSTVQFFYQSFKKQFPDNQVDKMKFTYQGPVPYSREMALVMMADSVEAASRSLREKTPESINDLVDNIIHYQMINEQYNNSNITYKDISTVKEIFKQKLINIYHARVEYPE